MKKLLKMTRCEKLFKKKENGGEMWGERCRIKNKRKESSRVDISLRTRFLKMVNTHHHTHTHTHTHTYIHIQESVTGSTAEAVEVVGAGLQ